MTWEHYQQWRQAMQSHIQKRQGEMRLTGGNAVVVQGSSIAITPDTRTPQPIPPETWTLQLWGRYEGEINGNPFSTDWSPAGTIFRTLELEPNFDFWDGTEVFNIPQEEPDPPVTRTVTVFVEVRAYDSQPERTVFEQNYYRIPVKVVFEFRKYLSGTPSSPGPYEVLNEIEATVRRPGWSRDLEAPGESPFLHYLVPVAVTHPG